MTGAPLPRHRHQLALQLQLLEQRIHEWKWRVRQWKRTGETDGEGRNDIKKMTEGSYLEGHTIIEPWLTTSQIAMEGVWSGPLTPLRDCGSDRDGSGSTPDPHMHCTRTHSRLTETWTALHQCLHLHPHKCSNWNSHLLLLLMLLTRSWRMWKMERFCSSVSLCLVTQNEWHCLTFFRLQGQESEMRGHSRIPVYGILRSSSS